MNIMGIQLIKKGLFNALAATHIAGPDLSDALNVCHDLAARGLRSTLCFWSKPEHRPSQIIETYIKAISAIAQRGFDCVCSVKAPDFRFDFELLKVVLDVARAEGGFVRFDAQDLSSADQTFALVEKAFAYYPHVGCTLPARWKRSFADAERIIDLKIPVRIVKGQWCDSGMPQVDVEACFLFLVGMFAGRGIAVTVATHDMVLARKASVKLKEQHSQCEFEQMFGLPLNGLMVARQLCIPLRVYVPYGCPGLPYNLSDARKRPAMVGWALRDIVLRRRGKIALVKNKYVEEKPLIPVYQHFEETKKLAIPQPSEIEEKN